MNMIISPVEAVAVISDKNAWFHFLNMLKETVKQAYLEWHHVSLVVRNKYWPTKNIQASIYTVYIYI